jgi:TatD DNase family protein
VVDTHCHLGLCEPPDAELVAAAREAGVKRMLTVGIDAERSREAIAAAERHEEVFACVGRHPNGATDFDDRDAEEVEQLAGHPRVAAIGETGLDYYRDRAPRDDQHRAFRAHIEIARRASKPLVIHVRDGGQTTDGEALSDTFELLRAEATGVTVVLHCFSAPAARALQAAEWGWFCSFAGNATYAAVPDGLLLVETDAPFLSPQPMRGKPNQPAHVVETAKAVAEVRGIDYDELERLVDANSTRVFGW